MAWDINLDEYMMPQQQAQSGSAPTGGWGLQPSQPSPSHAFGYGGETGVSAIPAGGLPPLSQQEQAVQRQSWQVADIEEPPAAGVRAVAPPVGQVAVERTGSTPPAATPSEAGGAGPWRQAISRMLAGFGTTLAGQQYTPPGEEEKKKQSSPWGAMIQAGRAMSGGSDVRMKRDIKPAGFEAKTLLEAIKKEGPKQYDYIPEMGGGHAYGPMAQTLEKGGPLGQSMVAQDKQGMRYLKPVEMQKGMLAMIAEQQRQIDELRGRDLSLEEGMGLPRRAKQSFDPFTLEAGGYGAPKGWTVPNPQSLPGQLVRRPRQAQVFPLGEESPLGPTPSLAHGVNWANAFSDTRTKRNIASASAEAGRLLGALEERQRFGASAEPQYQSERMVPPPAPVRRVLAPVSRPGSMATNAYAEQGLYPPGVTEDDLVALEARLSPRARLAAYNQEALPPDVTAADVEAATALLKRPRR